MYECIPKPAGVLISGFYWLMVVYISKQPGMDRSLTKVCTVVFKTANLQDENNESR